MACCACRGVLAFEESSSDELNHPHKQVSLPRIFKEWAIQWGNDLAARKMVPPSAERQQHSIRHKAH